MFEADKQRRLEWQQWKQLNARKLEHPAGFEERFVDVVLTQIKDVDPSDVIPQNDFTDQNGRKRRVDFLISNIEKGFNLPIELDGTSKDQSHREWNDFLERQNALISSFGTVLRYSNVKMLNNPQAIVSEIASTLAVQSARKRNIDQQRSYLSEMNKELSNPKPSIDVSAPSVKAELKSRWPWVVIGATILAIGGVSVFLMLPSGSQPTNSFTPAEAANRVGSTGTVCGKVASAREVSSGYFMNFGQPYPNQALSAVVWRRNMTAVGQLARTGDSICISGEIRTFDGRPIIEISEKSQITKQMRSEN